MANKDHTFHKHLLVLQQWAQMVKLKSKVIFKTMLDKINKVKQFLKNSKLIKIIKA